MTFWLWFYIGLLLNLLHYFYPESKSQPRWLVFTHMCISEQWLSSAHSVSGVVSVHPCPINTKYPFSIHLMPYVIIRFIMLTVLSSQCHKCTLWKYKKKKRNHQQVVKGSKWKSFYYRLISLCNDFYFKWGDVAHSGCAFHPNLPLIISMQKSGNKLLISELLKNSDVNCSWD